MTCLKTNIILKIIIIIFKWASSCGLVVKAEESLLRGFGFKPLLRRPFFRHHLFG
jgi:hypothetical protein